MPAIRLRTYSALSIFITTIVVAHTASNHQQFYPTVVNLVSSKLSRIVLINDAILLVVLLGLAGIRLFFGTLRTYEEEKSWENAYVTLIETCLALTIFRGEISSTIFAMLVSMLFLKIFHWIAQMRVQYIESLPSTPKTTFARLYSLMFLLLAVDGILSYLFIMHWWTNGPTVRVLFLTEYLIMTVKALTVGVRLNFHAYNLYRQYQQEQAHLRNQQQQQPQDQQQQQQPDQQQEQQNADIAPGWESHNVAIFYLDIAADLLQSGIYIAFFLVIMSKYGLPIHLIRDIYIAIRSARKRITDLINYRRLVNNLDQRFPDATPEELAENHLCVVCREELRFNVKKLPCGHLFHANCLRGWLEQTQECPTCRAPVDQEAYNAYIRDRNPGRANRNSNAAAAAAPTQNAQQQQQQAHHHHHQAQQQQQAQQQEQPIYGDATTNIQEMYARMVHNYMQQQQQQQHQQQQQASNMFLPQQFTMMGPMSNNIFMPTTTIEQQQEQLLENATAAASNQGSAQQIMINMYIQYLENSKRIIDSTLDQLRSLQDHTTQQQQQGPITATTSSSAENTSSSSNMDNDNY